MLKEIQFKSKEERYQFFNHPGYKNLEPSVRHRLEKIDRKLAVNGAILTCLFVIIWIPILLDSSGTLPIMLPLLSWLMIISPVCWWFYSHGKIFYELTGSVENFIIIFAVLKTYIIFLIIAYYELYVAFNIIIPLFLLLLYISWHIDDFRIRLKKRSSKG